MKIETAPIQPADLDSLRALIADPSLVDQFDMFQAPGALEDWLAGPHLDPSASRVARVGGRVAGFSLALVFETAARPWALVRIGVAAPDRRRGIGTALLRAAQAELARRPVPPAEVVTSAWLAAPDAGAGQPAAAAREALPAAGFSARHGFVHARYYWQMERPLGEPPVPRWPEGIEVRTFDGSDAGHQDWTDIYNDSFAEHYHFYPGTVAESRSIAAQSWFLPHGMLLAYRAGRVVGFCQNRIYPDAGEVAMLGTARAARGIGLGRALLRWGVAWLEARHVPRVTLMVDGENEGALKLYRDEGFSVVRTREIWSRTPEAIHAD
jgi:mycothiol synthase